MTRGQARTLLRKRIQEVVAVNWTDSELNVLLDLAAQDIQKRLLAKDAQYFGVVALADRIAEKTKTPLPGGFVQDLGLVEVRLTAGGAYVPVDKNTNLNIAASAPNSEGPEWTVFGRYLKVVPAVAVTITDGIRLSYVKAITMDDDSVVPPIDLFWHDAWVDAAARKAYRESQEKSDTTDAAVAEAKEDIVLTQRGSNQGKALLEVSGIYKGY